MPVFLLLCCNECSQKSCFVFCAQGRAPLTLPNQPPPPPPPPLRRARRSTAAAAPPAAAAVWAGRRSRAGCGRTCAARRRAACRPRPRRPRRTRRGGVSAHLRSLEPNAALSVLDGCAPVRLRRAVGRRQLSSVALLLCRDQSCSRFASRREHGRVAEDQRGVAEAAVRAEQREPHLDRHVPLRRRPLLLPTPPRSSDRQPHRHVEPRAGGGWRVQFRTSPSS